ncbi:BrnT family toxin [Paraburkholderia bonniea]|uniref:BrnT family toxin n=1 Tax=Paraburkholderia bonniea TaxID=2152891 RepID=UPI001291CB30|nr:BrnT family toxin [Paraburkholderia bonniea]
MEITYDPAKNQTNIAERGLSFEMAREFEMAGALISEDQRKAYPERRFQALGYIGTRMYMLVFTPRDEKLHVISFRKANLREVKHYEQEKSQ